MSLDIINQLAGIVAGSALDKARILDRIEPLADLFETVSGDVQLAPGTTAFEAPGHYPGHMALRLESAGSRAMLLADTAVSVLVGFQHRPPLDVARLRAMLGELNRLIYLEAGD